MKVIFPASVTDDVLVSSNIPEDDYAPWSAATNYARGDFAISIATHRIYRSLTADNIDNDPDLEQLALGSAELDPPEPINWQVIGATNRWKMFDNQSSQSTTAADNITVELEFGQFIRGFGFFGVVANTVTVTMHNGDDLVYERTVQMQDESVNVNWLAHVTEPIIQLPEAAHFDLPAFAQARVTVSFDGGGTVSVAQLVIGEVWVFGATGINGTGFSGLGFSEVETDGFGNVTAVPRGDARLPNYSIFCNAEELFSIEQRLRSVFKGRPAVWIGSDDARKALITYGILRGYRVIYRNQELAVLDIEVQGMTN